MKNNFKNILIIIFISLVTLLAFLIPKFYFEFYDKKITTLYEINQLSFKNIDNSNKLPNDEIINLLYSSDEKTIEVENEVNETIYNKNINIILEELYKINSNAGNYFKSNILPNYNNIYNFRLTDIYIHTKKDDFYPLKYFEIEGKMQYIYALYDPNDNAILSLDATNYQESHESKNTDIEHINLNDDYIKYLNSNLKTNNVECFIDNNIIYLTIFTNIIEQEQNYIEG